MTENILEVTNLEKRYDKNGFHLNNISFFVPKGSIVGLIGENGSGKTTTISTILGLRKKDGGSVKLFGKEFNNNDVEVKERIGVSFDEVYLPNNLKAREISKIYKNIYEFWDEDYFINTLEKLGISKEKKIGDYSKGMQKMLSIVLSMSHKPELLILDEPTSSLDPVKRSEVLGFFQEYVENGDKSIIFSSHITSDIEQICDYVIYINRGNLIFFEPTIKLLYEYGLVKCTKETFNKIPKHLIMACYSGEYQTSVLVNTRQDIESISGEFLLDNPTLEEIMNIYSKGEVYDRAY